MPSYPMMQYLLPGAAKAGYLGLARRVANELMAGPSPR
jgi:hypothetical protein